MPKQKWALPGFNGAGKAALLAFIRGEENPGAWSEAYQCERNYSSIAEVSFAEQQRLIERELLRDESDITDEVFQGTPVIELLEEVSADCEKIRELARQFDIDQLLDTGFRKLSSGETRKVLLIRAALADVELLLLNDPFEGLDKQARQLAQAFLDQLVKDRTVVFAVDNIETLPDFITDIAYIEQHRVKETFARTVDDKLEALRGLFSINTDTHIPNLPDDVFSAPRLDMKPGEPLLRMRNLSVAYQGKTVIQGLDWQVDPGQHWQLHGPNGSGKTTLLNLITGDHPQCYTNDIKLFGMQRGSGESIWDIKKPIGFVTSSLQWNYRVPGSALGVVISGLHDTVGIYQDINHAETEIAMAWLQLMGMADKARTSFRQLSHGDQRLTLIARAMIKRPTLLLLDEPCQGLDTINRQRVLAVVEKLIADGKTTLVYVTHHEEDHIEAIQHRLDLPVNSDN